MNENAPARGEECGFRRLSFRTACFWIFVALVAAFSIVERVCIMNAAVRLLFVVMTVFGLFVGALYLVKYLRDHPVAVYPSLFIFALFVTWAILGRKPVNVESLRWGYVRRLMNYKNVKFVENGETRAGIDDSGLARAALWQAMVKEGAKQANPRLLGPLLWKFWWRDLSSADILRGKYGYAEVIGHANQLAGYDTSHLLPGDMAVVGGSHVLVYVGDSKWIDAGPDVGKVVVSKATDYSKRKYYRMKATLLRWWLF
jgi:hypothetical protein